MRRTHFCKSRARRAAQVFACMATLSTVACDNDINFNPASPTWPFGQTSSDSALPEERNLRITGTLTAEQGSCLEATILYDDVEIEGSRTTCGQVEGCASLSITAEVQSDPGRHTIAFQVLRQTAETVEYRAEGTVQVTRDGLPGWTVDLPLGPTRARLRAAESIGFDIEFSN